MERRYSPWLSFALMAMAASAVSDPFVYGIDRPERPKKPSRPPQDWQSWRESPKPLTKRQKRRLHRAALAHCAEQAYRMADAMLAERVKP